MLEAICGWGEGPDILLVNSGKPYMLYDDPINLDRSKHGYSHKGSCELTLEEAESLVCSLQEAIRQVKELDASANEYFEIHNK